MTASDTGVFPPGSTIGILGGGQLGRMTALAAARLGYRCHVFSPESEAPAKDVASAHTTAAYEDHDAIESFARRVDVVTYEFENIPGDSLDLVAQLVPVRPDIGLLRISQDRILEKTSLNRLEVRTAAWKEVRSAVDLEAAVRALGLPVILKSARFGYDGKGQRLLTDRRDIASAGRQIDETGAVLEAVVEFEREISLIVARGIDGRIETYSPVDNVHRNHILHTTTAPSTAPAAIHEAAIALACRLADAFELVGLLAIEMFVTATGDLLVNEIAPRPHNSGHWTIDACTVSQFEQHVRAVTGLPLGSTDRHSDAVMTNLIGDAAESWPSLVREPRASLHLYRKTEARPGRKMGHVTRLIPRAQRP